MVGSTVGGGTGVLRSRGGRVLWSWGSRGSGYDVIVASCLNCEGV